MSRYTKEVNVRKNFKDLIRLDDQRKAKAPIKG